MITFIRSCYIAAPAIVERSPLSAAAADSAAARGLSEEEAAREQAALPKSPVDLARKLFAQVFSGVHW